MRWVLVACCLLGLACDDRRPELAAATELAQPYLRSFAEIDRWVRRVADGEDAPRTKEALAETLFARMRADPTVRGAWVTIDGDRKLELTLRGDAIAPLAAAATVRDPQLGVLRVVAVTHCPVASAAAPRNGEEACVLLSRQDRTASRALSLTVAFAQRAAEPYARRP
ncbi:MAG: hypothetical protein ACHQ53_01360 [Polyangiales bacterium]